MGTSAITAAVAGQVASYHSRFVRPFVFWVGVCVCACVRACMLTWPRWLLAKSFLFGHSCCSHLSLPCVAFCDVELLWDCEGEGELTSGIVLMGTLLAPLDSWCWFVITI